MEGVRDPLSSYQRDGLSPQRDKRTDALTHSQHCGGTLGCSSTPLSPD